MTKDKIKNVILGYQRLLAAKHRKDWEHLQSMCPKMLTLLEEGEVEKVCRWLGFMQGVFWERRIYTINQLRKHNIDGEVHFSYTMYDPDYGDQRECKCGHTYERHFDGYEDNDAVGCKYCRYDDCEGFRQAPETK